MLHEENQLEQMIRKIYLVIHFFIYSFFFKKKKKKKNRNYLMRRHAVDFGIPLINDSKCARLFSDALAKRGNPRDSIITWDEYLAQKYF